MGAERDVKTLAGVSGDAAVCCMGGVSWKVCRVR